MTDTSLSLSTHIDEPSAAPGQIEMLLFALDRSRAQFAWKVGGLDAEAIHRAHPPSAMTIAGLIKHVAGVEERVLALAVTGRRPAPPWDEVDPEDVGWDWRTAADDSPAELYAMWTATVERSRSVLRALVDGALDRPAALWFWDGEPPNVRRMLVDLHDEYARHVGHADLFREAIDGLVGEDPPQDPTEG